MSCTQFLKFPVHCCQTERALPLCFKKGIYRMISLERQRRHIFPRRGKKTLEIIECRSLSLYLFSVRRHRGLSDRKSVTWNAGRVMSKQLWCSSPQTRGSSVSVEDLPQVSGVLDKQMMENLCRKHTKNRNYHDWSLCFA